MIEMIYNEEEKYTAEERVLPEPKNVKQIGELRDYKKIFIEDEVHTFLLQYGREKEAAANIAILLGKAERSGGRRHFYIEGAIPVDHVTEKQGKYLFSEKLWGDIYQQCENFFPEQEILGWFLAKAGFPVEKTAVTEETHRTYFSGADKVLFIMEPLEGESGFFGFDGNRFAKQPGYCIYYGKNEAMKEFLLNKRSGEKGSEEKPDVIAANFRKILQEKQARNAKRKKMAISYGMKVSIALVFFVGAVTLKNQTEKIHTMEEQMNKLSGQEIVLEVSGDDVIVEELPGNVETQPEAVQEELITEEPVQEELIAEEPVQEELIAEEPKQELPLTETQEQQEPEEEPEKESAEEATAQPQTPETYTIQAGDSLAKISRDRYGSDDMVDEICALNKIENGDYIQVGETILLP